MDTRGTPAICSCFGFFDNGGELEVAGLVLIDAASRENWQKNPQQPQERGHPRESP
jgi:hypothetical protein